MSGTFTLEYDGKLISDFLPDHLRENVTVLKPEGASPISNLKEEFQNTLAHPMGMEHSFTDFVGERYTAGADVTIVVDDHTRPNIHTKIILPKLLRKLLDIGVRKKDIKLLISTGTHRPPTQAELRAEILGSEVYEEHKDRIWIHDCRKKNRKIGESNKGTPIFIDERLLDSHIVIPVTDSEYHYFAGVAGTVKAFVPGNAGEETVQKNHVKMFHPETGFKEGVKTGKTEGNPVITEIREMAKQVVKEVDVFSIDCIVDEGEIVHLCAGDLFACREAAKKVLPKLSEVKVEELGDVVIVSAGSLGINLYQAGKAFHAGWHAVKKDGKSWIIVLASCKDDWGKDPYYEAMKEVHDMDFDTAIKHLLTTRCTEENFEIGDQKSIDTLRILQSVGEGNLKIVSEMDHDVLKDVFHLIPVKEPGEEPQQALTRLLEEYSITYKEDPTIYLIKNPGALTILK